jgi:hypothetical protein
MAVYVGFKDLKPRYGIPYTAVHIARLVKQGRFPPPAKYAPNGRNHWTEEQIEQHQAQLLAAAASKQPTKI